MSRSLRQLPLALALLLALGCGEDPVSPGRPAPPGPSPDIVDAGHGTEAPGFYFLPPMADDPSATGTFDADIAPVVTVCEGAVTDCQSPVAEFTTTSGPGSETVRVVAEDENYIVNWHTDAFDLDPELTYRIVVSVVPSGASQPLVLGYADVDLVATAADRNEVDTDTFVPLVDGATLAVKFRVETGIVGRVVVDPSQAEIEVGDTRSFTATLYDLHGNELTAPSVSWSSDDEAVATVDGTGLATGESSGTAAITATSQRVSDAAALTVTTAGLSPTQVAKLLASDGASLDFFGASVAVDENIAVIGASGDDDNGGSSGSAYVFEYSSGTWTMVAKLTANDGDADDRFGMSVAVSGEFAVIGAQGDEENGAFSGSAYVFERSGGIWSEVAKLTASDGDSDDYFGAEVALDGDIAVIGAQGDDDGGSKSGSAYVFERSGGVWSETAKLTASDGAADDAFGRSAAVNGDIVVVGALGDDNSRGAGSGSAYVFERSAGVWSESAKLTASDGAPYDRFGSSVAVGGDIAVIGAQADDNRGSAYVFDGSSGTWMEVAKLTASDGALSDRFGTSVAVDGEVAVVGARFDDDSGMSSGSAYVFERSGANTWKQKAKLLADDGSADDEFGRAVAVSSAVAVIGSVFDDDSGTSSGSAYVFDLQP